MTVTYEAPPIRADLPVAFHPGWNKFPGLAVRGTSITVHPDEYFFRFENAEPTWTLCDWEGVRRTLLPVRETPDTTVEQTTLDHIREHGRRSGDPAEVLTTAYRVYAHLFRSEHLNDPTIAGLGVTPADLRVLVEMGTMMALNRVERDGRITNVGPAWMFGEAAKVVFGLSTKDAERVDELYHGGWFNEPRRIEQVKAHAALGGRLVHGCQSGVEQHMAGGCVAPFGVDIEEFHRELHHFRDEWVERVRACA